MSWWSCRDTNATGVLFLSGQFGIVLPVVVNYSERDGQIAGGLGNRYFLARRLGLRVGLDVARGTEDTAITIIIGSAWR